MPEPRLRNRGIPHVFRILVVEDDLETREGIVEYLSQEGADVTGLADAGSATERCRQERFDVIITDLRLPGRSGLALARRLEELAHPPAVILITAYPAWSVLKEADALGIDTILFKPFKLDCLMPAVEHVTGFRSNPYPGEGRA